MTTLTPSLSGESSSLYSPQKDGGSATRTQEKIRFVLAMVYPHQLTIESGKQVFFTASIVAFLALNAMLGLHYYGMTFPTAHPFLRFLTSQKPKHSDTTPVMIHPPPPLPTSPVSSVEIFSTTTQRPRCHRLPRMRHE